MNGDNLIIQVRRILKDVPTNVSQGEFWDDREIILALNVAQDMFLKFAIENDLHYLLAPLVTVTANMQGMRDYVFDPPYLHYIGAEVGDDGVEKPARFYLGGDGVYYQNTAVLSCSLINNDLLFTDGRLAVPRNGRGKLAYYKRPSYIGATSLGDDTRPDFNTQDFEDYVYKDLIANQAAIICGAKETQNQRSFKKHIRAIIYQIANPAVYANYLINPDFSGYIPRQQEPQ